MSDTKEFQLEAVPARAKRAGETSPPWGWVEPTVWTERMLTALDRGGQRGSLVQSDGQGPSRTHLATRRTFGSPPMRGPPG